MQRHPASLRGAGRPARRRNAALVVVGDRLGLYRALAERGPSTAEELAAATGTTERNVCEWLSAQSAAAYVTYDGPVGDGGADRFSLSPEQTEALTASAD